MQSFLVLKLSDILLSSSPHNGTVSRLFHDSYLAFLTPSWQLPYHARVLNEVGLQMQYYNTKRNIDDVAGDVLGSCGYEI